MCYNRLVGRRERSKPRKANQSGAIFWKHGGESSGTDGRVIVAKRRHLLHVKAYCFDENASTNIPPGTHRV